MVSIQIAKEYIMDIPFIVILLSLIVIIFLCMIRVDDPENEDLFQPFAVTTAVIIAVISAAKRRMAEKERNMRD